MNNPYFLVRIKYDDRQGTIGTLRTDHRCEAGEMVYGQQGRATVTHCHFVTPVASKMVITSRGAYTVRADVPTPLHDDDSQDDLPLPRGSDRYCI